MGAQAVSLSQKVRYVKAQEQTRDHTCHWPGCKSQVPLAKWGCSHHWFKLPKDIRDAIWAAYRPTQEVDCRPDEAYIRAAQRAQDWIAQKPQDTAKPRASKSKRPNERSQLSLPL